jgi:hypothetical protein
LLELQIRKRIFDRTENLFLQVQTRALELQPYSVQCCKQHELRVYFHKSWYENNFRSVYGKLQIHKYQLNIYQKLINLEAIKIIRIARGIHAYYLPLFCRLSMFFHDNHLQKRGFRINH